MLKGMPSTGVGRATAKTTYTSEWSLVTMVATPEVQLTNLPKQTIEMAWDESVRGKIEL